MAEATYPGLDAAGWALQKQVDLKISDDLKTAETALAKLHRDMEAINRLPKPPYPSVIEQMERTLEPIRRHQLAISRALEMPGAMARIQDMASAKQHRQALIEQTLTSRIAESHATAHQSWLERLKPLQHDFSHLSRLLASARQTLCDTSLGLTATERLTRASIARR